MNKKNTQSSSSSNFDDKDIIKTTSSREDNIQVDNVNTSYSKTKNYSQNKILANKKTDVFIQNGGASENEEIRFEFKISVDSTRLRNQSRVFSTNFKTHGVYNFPKLFGTSESKSDELLEELYIYSFFKSLYYIYFPNTLVDNFTGGYCFIGHSKLFSLFRQDTYSFASEGVATHIKLDKGSEAERKISFALLMSEFGFFNKYLGELPPLGEGTFMIFKLETLLSKLVEDYYAKRAGGEPGFYSNKQDFKEGRNLKEIAVQDNNKGSILITDVKSEDSMSIRTQAENPLTNCFFGKSCKKLYHFEVNGNFVIQFNESFFFNLANFVVVNEQHEGFSDIQRYYKMTPITNKQLFFVQSEVYVNTGIKPQFKLYSNVEAGSTILPNKPIPKLGDLLKKLPDKLEYLTEIYEEIRTILEETKGEDSTEK